MDLVGWVRGKRGEERRKILKHHHQESSLATTNNSRKSCSERVGEICCIMTYDKKINLVDIVEC